MTALLAIVAVVLVAINVMAVLATGTYQSRGIMLADAFGYAVLGPALMASLFLIAKSNRSWRRYLAAFCVLSALAGASKVMDAAKAAKPRPPQVVHATGSNATLSVPADWRTSERKTSQAIYVVSRLSTEAVALNSVPKAEAGQDFKEFSATFLANQRTLPSFRDATGPTACPIAAGRCEAYEVRHVSGTTTVVSLLYLIESRAAYHVLLASTNEPLFERSKARLTEIAASFSPGE